MKHYYFCLLAIVLIVYGVWWWFMGPLISLFIAGTLFVGLALIEGLVAFVERMD